MNAASGSVRPFRTAEFGGSRPTVPYTGHPFFCTAPMRSKFIRRFMSCSGKNIVPPRAVDGRPVAAAGRGPGFLACSRGDGEGRSDRHRVSDAAPQVGRFGDVVVEQFAGK